MSMMKPGQVLLGLFETLNKKLHVLQKHQNGGRLAQIIRLYTIVNHLITH